MGSTGSAESSGSSWALDLLLVGGVIVLLGIGGYAVYTIIGKPLQWVTGAEEKIEHWYDDIHLLPQADPKTGAPASTGDQVLNLVTWLFPLPKLVYQVTQGEMDRGSFDYAGVHGRDQHKETKK